MHIKTRNTPRTGIPKGPAFRSKEPLTGSVASSSKKRSGGEIEEQRPSKMFHLVDAAASKKTTASPSAVQSKDNVAAPATLTGGHVLPPSAPIELPLRPLPIPSSLPSTAPAPSIASHSSELGEQDESAFNFAMGLPIFNAHATDLSKLLGSYDPLDDEHDDDNDDERFGEPLEAFHAEFYKLGGLLANGEELSTNESADSSGDEFDSDEDEFDSDDEESDYSEYGDEEVDRASLIGDDEEKEEWEEHEHSDAELDAEEGVSASGDEEIEETELEGEEESKC